MNHTKPAYKKNLLALIYAIALVFGFGNVVLSQDSTLTSMRPKYAQVNIFYDFPQSYGLTTAIDFPVKSIARTDVYKDGETLFRQHDLVFGLTAEFYRYPFNYTGIVFTPSIGIRRYVKPRFFHETKLGVGVMRTFYDGKVYEVDAQGNVKERSLFGRFYGTLHISEAFDWQLQKPGHNIVAIQIKPSLWFQYPFNSTIKPHVSFEAGIKYELRKVAVKTRSVIKHHKKK